MKLKLIGVVALLLLVSMMFATPTHALTPSTCYNPGNYDFFSAITSSLEVYWKNTFYKQGDGQLSCIMQKSSVSDGTDFIGTFIENAGGDLYLYYNSYNTLSSNGIVQGSALVLASGSWKSDSQFWAASNGITHSGTFYFGIATYGYNVTGYEVVQFTSLTMTYSGTASTPVVVVGSTYTYSLAGISSNREVAVAAYHGPLTTFIQTNGYVWVLVSSGPSPSSSGDIVFLRTSAQNWTGSGLAAYSTSYVNYNINPVMMTFTETTNYVYGILGPAQINQMFMAPALYKVATSLTVPIGSQYGTATTPVVGFGDLNGNNIFFWYEDSSTVGTGYGVRIVNFDEASSSMHSSLGINPTGTGQWYGASTFLLANTANAYGLIVMADDFRAYEYHTFDSGNSLQGPNKIFAVTTPEPHNYLNQQIDTPYLTINGTSVPSGGYGDIMLFQQVTLNGHTIPTVYGQFATITKVVVQVTLTSFTYSSTYLVNSTISVNGTPPIANYFIEVLTLFLVAGMVLIIDRKFTGLLIATSAALVLSWLLDILPWPVMIIPVFLTTIAIISKSRSG